MTHHTVNASIRAKSGAEILHRTPLWSGDAEDARHAIAQALVPLKPIVVATALADTIVIHAIGPGGVRTTTTEYAEDFKIAPGASLGQTSLVDGADHGLSVGQLEHARQALRNAAVAAMPGVAEKVAEKDGVKDFFNAMPARASKESLRRVGGYDLGRQSDSQGNGPNVRPATHEDMKTFGRVGENPDDYVVESVKGHLMPKAARGSLSPDGLGLRDPAERPVLGRIQGKHSGKTLGVSTPRNYDAARIIESINQAAIDMRRATGSAPARILVGRGAYDALCRQAGGPVNTVAGIPITVNDSDGAQDLSCIMAPRVDPRSYGKSPLQWIADESASVPMEDFERIKREYFNVYPAVRSIHRTISGDIYS